MIEISMTNTSSLVASTFSKEPLLEQILYMPASGSFTADFATSVVNNGKLNLLKHSKRDMLQDSNGLITEDLESLKNVGDLRPLRSYPDTSSHKLYV